MNLKNKTAIVTGASSGLGREICVLLANEGVNIVGASRSEAEVVGEIKNAGGKAIWIKADVTKEKDVENIFRKARRKFGKIDIVINNAGILLSKSISKTSYDEFQKVMTVNAGGAFLGCKFARKYMKNGTIINTSSDVGLFGKPNLSAYSASKFAIIGITESLAKEFKPGIKVYAVTPHSIATPMSKGRGNSPPKIAKVYIDILKGKRKVKTGDHVIAGTLKATNKNWKNVPKAKLKIKTNS